MADPGVRTEPNASVENAFAVIRFLATADSPVGVADIARQLGLSLTTTHRVVTTLCEADFVSQRGEGGKYEPGLRVRELMMALYRRYPIRSAATPAMRELARLTGQAATLTVRFGSRALRIAGVQDHKYVHRPLLIGETTPLGVGAASLAILTGQDDGTIKSIIAGLRGVVYSRPRAQISREIEAARAAGYVIQESDGLTVVAFPIHNLDRTAVAAIALEGASVQFRPPQARQLKRMQAIVSRLQDACDAQPTLLNGPFDRIADAAMNPPTAQ